MASGLRYHIKINELQNEISGRNDFTELFKREYFIAARKIQAWFRGNVTRKHLFMLHKEAIIIQSNWRGYYVRNNFDKVIISKVHQMWEDYYNCMATRIQALWRGYWIRKTYSNFYERMRWLNNVYAKNEEIVETMQKFKENEINYIRNVLERESLLWILFILFKLHHLLRTKVRPGVITRIDQTNFTLIEKMLRCLKYQFYTPKKLTFCDHYKLEKQFPSIFHGTFLARCEKEIRNFEYKLKTGNISIYRSYSYTKEEKLRNKLQNLGHDFIKTYNNKHTVSMESIDINSKKCINFGRHRMHKLKKDEDVCEKKVLHEVFLNSNATFIDPYYNCDTVGIVQKIPYIQVSPENSLTVHFSSACVKCGMCIAIANQINDTLLEIHESLDTWLNDTEAVILLRNICNFAFKHYSLREINGKRYICDHVPGSTLVTSSGDGLWETHLRDNCHEYLNEIDPLELYQHWQQWCQDDNKNPDLVTILCRNDAGKLRDCRSMDDMIKYELPSKNYQTDIKIKVEFGC
ncbi:spermatogenesis-associated protein 17-like isoform X2 [Vespula maculifrons]|uniref:Spermatogenesis-associated protein 17-like isoform X2 n=1 Tax=Vespula maculifrons TaxID=7453 RepID=A0ABD2CQN6_VESMC